MKNLIINIAILLLKYRIKKAKQFIKNEKNALVCKAFNHMIQSYETTIMFLKSEKDILI